MQRGLTLDPDYHRGSRSNLGWSGEEKDEKNFSNESVTDMMLIASGGVEAGREDATIYRSKSSQDFNNRH